MISIGRCVESLDPRRMAVRCKGRFSNLPASVWNTTRSGWGSRGRAFGLLGALVLTLTGCGGGGSGNGGVASGPSAIQGLAVGNTILGAPQLAAILETGEMYSFILSGTQVALVDHGTLLVGGGVLTGNLTEYNVTANTQTTGAIFVGTYSPASATVAGGLSIETSFSNGTNLNTYTAQFLTQSPYSNPAQQSALTGSYSAPYLYNGSALILTIDATGNITGTSSGCALTGHAAPHGTTLDLYDIQLSQSGAGCLPAGVTTVSGIAFLYAAPNVTKPTLYVGALNANKSNGFFWAGVQQ